jgi:hypothetical protein
MEFSLVCGHVGLCGSEVPTVAAKETVLPAGGKSGHVLGGDICICLLHSFMVMVRYGDPKRTVGSKL